MNHPCIQQNKLRMRERIEELLFGVFNSQLERPHHSEVTIYDFVLGMHVQTFHLHTGPYEK